MKELNHDILTKALANLPQYEPPAGIWFALEESLDTEAYLAETVPQLPQYEPPAAIWEQLEKHLPERAAGPTPKVRRLIFSPWAAAAALALLLTAWWWRRPAAPATLAVSQEIVDNSLLADNREADDEAFQLVQNLCREEIPICEEPVFKSLKNELDELTKARTELKSALGDYGDDTELHNQLARIERERSELLRQMMALI